MKPLDPRLLRHARAARGVLLLGALLGAIRTAAILAWCWCLANALTTAVLPVLDDLGGGTGRVGEGSAPVSALSVYVAGALCAVIIRSAATWGMDVVAARGAVRVKTQLRAAALDALDGVSPLAASKRSEAELTTALGRGLDALDGYFSGYVPQLILTAVATPVMILAVLIADPLSGVIVVIVFPIIPIFMILIGLATQAVQDQQWSQLQRLSVSFLDAVSGLTTLKIFGRESRQSTRITRETEEYRSRTMKVLRVTFLSGFVLDLAGTFSIALVAVTVGTRLVAGEFPLVLGLFVLLLLPEVFIPIRQVGAAFHASTEGLSASAEVFDIIETANGERQAADTGAPGPVTGSELRLSDVRLVRGDQHVIGPVSFDVQPGEVVALAGPSGAGKSSLVALLLGFLQADSGAVSRPEVVAWSGQRAGLMQGSIAENVALGAESIDEAQVREVLDAVGLEQLSSDQPLGALGAGVSGGQAQRIALARALYRSHTMQAGALLLDEPSSALDHDSEQTICRAIRAEAERGRAVLLVSHRPALLEAADRVVRLEAQLTPAQGGAR